MKRSSTATSKSKKICWDGKYFKQVRLGVHMLTGDNDNFQSKYLIIGKCISSMSLYIAEGSKSFTNKVHLYLHGWQVKFTSVNQCYLHRWREKVRSLNNIQSSSLKQTPCGKDSPLTRIKNTDSKTNSKNPKLFIRLELHCCYLYEV